MATGAGLSESHRDSQETCTVQAANAPRSHRAEVGNKTNKELEVGRTRAVLKGVSI